ncbi:5'-adenylylsulfate reductase-like 4 [Helianthus annuus]|uniref:5'-adenylylsulfate reductase-like 4 n=1 Tax=Helianthus annuus TaxID=4232 RepID=UPI000B904986|nr:5'-adenylylsulfate reductase-like 4 [Helianthus annuus]
MGILPFGFVLLAIFVTLTYADDTSRVSKSVCPLKSIKDSIFASLSPVCPMNSIDYSFGVIEGDEMSLQKALNMVNGNAESYVVFLFYAFPATSFFRSEPSHASIEHMAVMIKDLILAGFIFQI